MIKLKVIKGFLNRTDENGYVLACELVSNDSVEIVFSENLILKNNLEIVGKIIDIQQNPQLKRRYIIEILLSDSYKREFIGVEVEICNAHDG